jgi:DNA-binding NtrC family response regulator
MGANICSKEDRILIVDDDYSVRDFLERFLKQKGYQYIQSAVTGQEALEIIKKEDIRLVLLDVKLPVMDGLEVLRRIKEIKKDMGVIMITGFPDEARAKEAMKEGAYDYIIKPFDLAYLELSVLTKIALSE